jgi:NAD(P)-dependent dehydrogenase (short-subunit alcohol dehydrogenase family)
MIFGITFAMEKIILLTGASDYIGSLYWCALLTAGYGVVGLDNDSWLGLCTNPDGFSYA